jgi:hypothetical protein
MMLAWLVVVLAPLATVGSASLLHALLYLAPALLFLLPLLLNRDPAGDALVALADPRRGRAHAAGCTGPLLAFHRPVVWLPRGGLLIATATAGRPPPRILLAAVLAQG